MKKQQYQGLVYQPKFIEECNKHTGEKFDLSNKAITDNELIAIARNLNNNQNIQELNLSNNAIDNIASLITILRQNNKIENLDLSHNKIGYNGSSARPDIDLSGNTTLVTLNLSHNYIGDDADTSGPWLGQNTSLVELNLAKNGIDCLTKIPEALKNNSILQRLDLSDNSLTKQAIKNLSKGIKVNNGLLYLNLAKNKISDLGDLTKALENNSKLLELDLSETGLGADSLQKLGAALKNNYTLDKLNLSYNHQNDQKVIINFISSLQANTSITTLTLKSVGLGDESLASIAGDMSRNKTIKILDLEFNNITEKGAQDIANIIESNKTLVKLNLNTNKLENNGTEKVLTSLAFNDTLQFLDLRNNDSKLALSTEIIKALKCNYTITNIESDIADPNGNVSQLLQENQNGNGYQRAMGNRWLEFSLTDTPTKKQLECMIEAFIKIDDKDVEGFIEDNIQSIFKNSIFDQKEKLDFLHAAIHILLSKLENFDANGVGLNIDLSSAELDPKKLGHFIAQIYYLNDGKIKEFKLPEENLEVSFQELSVDSEKQYIFIQEFLAQHNIADLNLSGCSVKYQGNHIANVGVFATLLLESSQEVKKINLKNTDISFSTIEYILKILQGEYETNEETNERELCKNISLTEFAFDKVDVISAELKKLYQGKKFFDSVLKNGKFLFEKEDVKYALGFFEKYQPSNTQGLDQSGLPNLVKILKSCISNEWRVKDANDFLKQIMGIFEKIDKIADAIDDELKNNLKEILPKDPESREEVEDGKSEDKELQKNAFDYLDEDKDLSGKEEEVYWET